MLIVNTAYLTKEVLDVFLASTPHHHRTLVTDWVTNEWMKRYQPIGKTYGDGVVRVLEYLERDGFCMGVADKLGAPSGDPDSWSTLTKTLPALARVDTNFPRMTAGQVRQAEQVCIAMASYKATNPGSQQDITHTQLASLQELNIPCIWVETWDVARRTRPMTWAQARQQNVSESDLQLRELAALVVSRLTANAKKANPSRTMTYKEVVSDVADLADLAEGLSYDRLDALDRHWAAQMAKNDSLPVDQQMAHVHVLLTEFIERYVNTFYNPLGLYVEDPATQIALDLRIVNAMFVVVGSKLKDEPYTPPEDLLSEEQLQVCQCTYEDALRMGKEFTPPVSPETISVVWTSLHHLPKSHLSFRLNQQDNRMRASETKRRYATTGDSNAHS